MLQPLDVRMQVAHYPAFKAHSLTLVDCLIARTSQDDGRMRKTRYNVTMTRQ